MTIKRLILKQPICVEFPRSFAKVIMLYNSHHLVASNQFTYNKKDKAFLNRYQNDF